MFRIGKLSWDNQQVRRELEVILGQALSRAISSAYEGVGEVQQAGARLAKRFRCVAPPGTDSGRLGRVTVWTKSRVPILRPPIPDSGSVQGAGWEEEQRRWAENALDDPEVVSELEAITKVIGQRVEPHEVIARFPAALDHVLRRSPRNATKEMLLKLRVSGEWAREQLDPKPHPAAVLGSSAALGAILAVGGFAVGLVAWVAIVIGLALALTVGLAMIWVTRFPSRHEHTLAVRMSTVRWVGELFNEIGPTDLRGATPDTIEGALRAAIDRTASASSALPSDLDERLRHTLGELLDDLSNRLIRRAEAVADNQLVAALYTVEDHGGRERRRPDPATVAALYSAMLDVVAICLPPLPRSALSRGAREIVQAFSLLTAQIPQVQQLEAHNQDARQPRLASSPPGRRHDDQAAIALGGGSGTAASLLRVHLELSLSPTGRWDLRRLRPGYVPSPPPQFTDRNWRRDRAFPGSTLNLLDLTGPRNKDRHSCVIEGKVHGSDPPRRLTATLKRDGRGVIRVEDLCSHHTVDVEQLTAELVAAVQGLVLHANHGSLKKGKAILRVQLDRETNGDEPPRPVQLRSRPNGPVAGSLEANVTASASTAIETRAVGKSIATQLQASRVLLIKLLDACGASDPGLITRQGIPTAATWSEQRRSAIEAWAQLWKISWALAPPPPRPDNGG